MANLKYYLDDSPYARRPKTLAVLISPGRSGSIFLTHCLSNHPQIFCPRGSVLGHGYSVRTVMGSVSSRQGATRPLCLAAAWAARGYDAAVAKVGYKPHVHVWGYMAERQAKIIHLTRENFVRVVVSRKVYRLGIRNKEPSKIYSFKPVPMTRVKLGWPNFLKALEQLEQMVTAMRAKIAATGLETLELTYEQLVGREGEEVARVNHSTHFRICKFLDVDCTYYLYTRLRKVNPYPLSEIVKNWDEIRPKILDSKYAKFLEDE